MVVRRAVLAAVVGGLAAALCVVAAYLLHPGLAYEMDRPLPAFISGMYAHERDPQGSFAWTSGQVTAAISGLDRQVAWSCTIRFRGARPAGQPRPMLTVTVDGRTVAHVAGADEYQDLGVPIPSATVPGVVIGMTVAPTFVPGGSDSRTLGVQIDRFLCRPSTALVRPPSNTLSLAALAAAIFAAGLALVGVSLSSAMFAAAAIGLGQTVMLAIGSGMYGAYAGTLPWLAAWVAAIAVLAARVIERWRREPLTSSARFVVAAAASIAYLLMVGLLHPAKPVIDAEFHAHRFDQVLRGGYFFVQPMPDGVTFPYAIGLYVFAAPWAWATANHVALVRAVAAVSFVLAGTLLYPVLTRAWNDRRAGAFAAVLIQLAPLPLVTLGNANLTNLFGQAMALAVMAAAVQWQLDPKRSGPLAGFAVLTTWALCSHVSTVTTLSAALGVLAVLYWWRGDQARRRAAAAIVIVMAVSLLASWLLYYGHFIETYRFAFSRMFADRTPEELAAAAVVVKGNMGPGERVLDLGRQLTMAYGWPILLLAALGVWSLVRRRSRGRLESALIAWAAVWVVFSVSTVLAPVGAAYVRYSAEFLSRVNLATLPLVAILAARGAAFGWAPDAPAGAKRLLQIGSIVLVFATLGVALQAWIRWIV